MILIKVADMIMCAIRADLLMGDINIVQKRLKLNHGTGGSLNAVIASVIVIMRGHFQTDTSGVLK